MHEILYASNANEAFKVTLEDVLVNGLDMRAANSNSIGSGKASKEIHNFHLIIKEPRQRLLWNSKRTFNLTGAIARFIWMMAGNNRLADIQFYWGSAIAPFTDDGVTVPGSSYGARMFNSSPGQNQVESIIHRLKDDPTSRRAAVSIYQPNDAIRESKDIPCTFGLFYHIREGKLLSSVIMRSNNAFILLPYNIFEFSLLAEVIANEVKVPLGHMCYNAMSMHIYEEHYNNAQDVVASDDIQDIKEFPTMPAHPSPMQEVRKLVRLEAHIRHLSAGLNNDNINDWLKPSVKIDADEIQLNEYWRQFYYLLLYHIVNKKTNDKRALEKIANKIQEPYKSYLKDSDWQSPQQSPSIGIQQDLFGNNTVTPDFMAFNQYNSRLKSLDDLCSIHNEEASEQNIINLHKYMQLRNDLVGDTTQALNVAARGQKSQVSVEEFQRALDKLA